MSAPPVETAAVPAPLLGLHVHATLRAGKLVGVRLAREPGAAPASEAMRALLARIARHVETGREDLSDVEVDLSGVSGFHRRALEHIHAHLKPGTLATYGELARALGSPDASRAVGAAMARNPIPFVVPCHRVIGAGRQVTNYSGEGGWATKRALLRLERAPISLLPE